MRELEIFPRLEPGWRTQNGLGPVPCIMKFPYLEILIQVTLFCSVGIWSMATIPSQSWRLPQLRGLDALGVAA